MNHSTLITVLSVFVLSLNVAFAQSGEKAVKSETHAAKIVDLNDDKHKKMTLDDVLKKHKGKVIYLDLWASWCGPCKKEMPSSQRLKEEYQDQEVAFVYISTDKNGNSWLNMIESLGLSGYHYRASPDVTMEIVKRYNLQFIPRYILINKEGKVADANAKRPSDPMVKSDINKLLM